MTQINSNSPGGIQAKIQSALNGVQTVLPKNSALQINGKAVTQAQMITTLQGFLTPYTTVATAKQAYAQAVQLRAGQQANAHQYLTLLKSALQAFFGKASPALVQFGMAAKQRTAPTTETVMLAQAKRQLTRKLRGTLGSKQKIKVKTVGTPDVSLGLTGKEVSPGVAAVAEAAATAQVNGGSSPATTANPPPVAPATDAGSTGAALSAVPVKSS